MRSSRSSRDPQYLFHSERMRALGREERGVVLRDQLDCGGVSLISHYTCMSIGDREQGDRSLEIAHFAGHWAQGTGRRRISGVEHTSLTLEPRIVHDDGVDTYEDSVVHRPQPDSGGSVCSFILPNSSLPKEHIDP
jgi:hypothetical protein